MISEHVIDGRTFLNTNSLYKKALYNIEYKLKVQLKTKTITSLIVIVVLLMLFSLSAQSAETQTTFTSTTNFNIPELNGNIHFAFDGYYREAILESNMWTFKGLVLNNTQTTQNYGFTDFKSISDLKISVENSNITIWGHLSFNYYMPIDMVVFSVEGKGAQTVNLCLNSTEPTNAAEWSVVTDNGATFLAEGSGWNLLPDNSVRVNGLTGNITVVHYSLNDPALANLSFFMQHYVVIFTVIVVVVVVVVAGIISVRKWRKKSKQ